MGKVNSVQWVTLCLGVLAVGCTDRRGERRDTADNTEEVSALDVGDVWRHEPDMGPAPDAATKEDAPDPEDVGAEDVESGVVDIPKAPDLVDPADVPTVPDLGPEDVPELEGFGPVDAAPDDDVPDTGSDECDYPGQPSTCPYDPVLTYCRYEPKTANLVCSDGDNPGISYGEPCTDGHECQLGLGCHFGICTQYCEFAIAFCPDAKWTCAQIGHPKFGACKP